MRRRRDDRWARWLVATVMLFTHGGFPALVHAQGAGAADPIGADARIAGLERVFAALDAAAGTIDRDTFDPEAVLFSVDLDPEALFRWVRDETTLVPYRGALRGSVGVLMDRVGNSLDRALLLSELLQLLGYDTRLANARLTPELALSLHAGLRPLASSRPPQVTDPSSELARYVADYGLDAALVEATLAEAAARRRFVEEHVEMRVPTQTSSLLDVVGAAVATEAITADQVESLQDHWWVQYGDRGVWVDLDPSSPSAEMGAAFTTPDAVHETLGLDALPAGLVHTVQVRVVLECQADGGLREETLVESSRLAAAALLGTHLAVQSAPRSWPGNEGQAAAGDDDVREALLAEDTWIPTIRIGNDRILDRAFDATCELSDARDALDPLKQLGGSSGGAFGGVFDVLTGPAEGEGDDAPPTVTAQWLEFVLHAPGRPDEVVRRQVFDLLGPAARSAGRALAELDDERALAWRLALLGETEIVVLAAQPSQAFLEHLTARRLLAQREIVIGWLQGPDDARLRELEERASQLEPVPGMLLALAVARGGWRDGAGVYLDRPNILAQHFQSRLAGDGGLTQLQAFDIVVNHVAVDPTASSPFAARLAQGVLDTNLEGLLGGLSCHGLVDIVCNAYGNAADRFAAAGAPEDWLVLTGSADLDALAGGWPDDALTRVRSDLEQGLVVVLPPLAGVGGGADEPVWWRIDPVTGQALGVGASGWGQDMAEYAMVVNFIGLMFCAKGAGKDRAAKAMCLVGFAMGIGGMGMTGHTQGMAAILAAVAYGLGGLGSGQ